MRFSRIFQICAVLACCIIATSVYAIGADPILHFSFDEGSGEEAKRFIY